MVHVKWMYEERDLMRSFKRTQKHPGESFVYFRQHHVCGDVQPCALTVLLPPLRLESGRDRAVGGDSSVASGVITHPGHSCVDGDARATDGNDVRRRTSGSAPPPPRHPLSAPAPAPAAAAAPGAVHAGDCRRRRTTHGANRRGAVWCANRTSSGARASALCHHNRWGFRAFGGTSTGMI